MDTEYIKAYKEIIENGGIIGVPTETVYGLAVNALDRIAVDRLYELKGRPSVKPMAIMISSIDKAKDYCFDIPDAALELAKKFWPGPLSIVLKSNGTVSENVTAGKDTIALRCPDCEITLELLKELSVPIAAPSANPSGFPAATNAEKVLEYFPAGIDGVIDGGETREGIASTIISLVNYAEGEYEVIRGGALPVEEIDDYLFSLVELIGITGTTGSGKTTALKVFRDSDFYCIDCDELYHRLLESESAMLFELNSEFPAAFVNGSLDRKRLGSIVFSDDDKLRKLNTITYEHVFASIRREIVSAALKGYKNCVIDAIGLLESGIGAMCKKKICITADKSCRKNRITQRDGIDIAYAEKRISSQKEDSFFVGNCDIHIENNGTLEEYVEKISSIIKEIKNECYQR